MQIFLDIKYLLLEPRHTGKPRTESYADLEQGGLSVGDSVDDIVAGTNGSTTRGRGNGRGGIGRGEESRGRSVLSGV